jgi:hypothetical protein
MKGGKTMKIREQRVSLFYAGNKKFIVFFFSFSNTPCNSGYVEALSKILLRTMYNGIYLEALSKWATFNSARV